MEQLKSYRGVYLDINKSDIAVLKNGLYFYFCSEKMKEKFETLADSYIKDRLEKIKRILPTTELQGYELVLLIEYYRYVEKRGFRIETFRGARIKQGHLLGDVEFEEIKEG